MHRRPLSIAVAVLALGSTGAFAARPHGPLGAPALPAVRAVATLAADTPQGTDARVLLASSSSPAPPAPDAPAGRVAAALDALSPRAGRTSAPEALRRAFEAYYAFRAEHGDEVRKPYLYFVDYGLDNHTPRGWVFDMDAMRLVEGPFTVAHGRGSARARDGVPTRFSNSPGSAASSLGLFLTQETYGFSGHAGRRLYHSVGLRLEGESGRFNDAARARGVVVHGAPYVSARGAGRSEGCPAMSQDRAHRLIPMLAEGSLVFLYSPNDTAWLDHGPWVGGGR